MAPLPATPAATSHSAQYIYEVSRERSMQDEEKLCGTPGTSVRTTKTNNRDVKYDAAHAPVYERHGAITKSNLRNAACF